MMKTTLSAKLKNTPWNSSHVPSSVSGWLNRDESLSAVYIVLTDNIGDENLFLCFSSGKQKEDRT